MRTKNEEYVCPHCGDVEDIECTDMDFDTECVVRKMWCPHCDNTWREYFIIRYDGYSDDSGSYNADGEKEGEDE